MAQFSAADPIVILSYARTPMGGMQGALAEVSATDLGATAVKAAVERRVLGLVSCRRGAVEPRTIVLGCRGRHLRSLTWRGWNSDVAIGRGAGDTRVQLSRPEECAGVGGFVYTRARVGARRYVIDCPIV